MAYPVVTRKAANELVVQLLAKREDSENLLDVLPEQGSDAVEMREGPEYDRQAVDRASLQMREQYLPDFNPGGGEKLPLGPQTTLEADMAGPLHSVLGRFEVQILQDGDFWRYLALFPFRWFLLAREPELQPQDFGGLSEKKREGAVVGWTKTNMKYQLLLRTYLWGRCAFDDEDELGGPGDVYRRATVIGEDGPSVIDVWHSHIVRIQMGQLGEIPHAFVDVSAETPLNTDEARELEKLLTRMKHNVLLDVYPYSGARSLVESQVSFAKERAK